MLNELLPRMCEQDNSLSVEILTLPGTHRPLPVHSAISARPISFQPFGGWRPRAFWRYLELPINRWFSNRAIARAVGRGGGAIWHSAFYHLPGEWQGPIVTTMLDMAYERFPAIFKSATHHALIRAKRECIRRSDMVICISEATCQDVIDLHGADPAKTVVVHLAPSQVFHAATEYENLLELNLPANFLLHLGNRSANKNFSFLLNAYASWPGRSDLPLVVVGHDWNSGEENQIVELGLENDLFRIPHQPDEVLAQLYRRAAAFLFPSIYEGFGMPLLEAMACGCPVVSSRIPSSVEVGGQIPFYFDPLSIPEFHAALDQALAIPRNDVRLQQGLAWSGQFTWDAAAAQTLAVYRQLVGR
jgi:glycosyltransferase involved in cell wall biosynthesis